MAVLKADGTKPKEREVLLILSKVFPNIGRSFLTTLAGTGMDRQVVGLKASTILEKVSRETV